MVLGAFFVLTPNQRTFRDMQNVLSEQDHFVYGEQDFLNMYFNGDARTELSFE